MVGFGSQAEPAAFKLFGSRIEFALLLLDCATPQCCEVFGRCHLFGASGPKPLGFKALLLAISFECGVLLADFFLERCELLLFRTESRPLLFETILLGTERPVLLL